MTGHNGAGKSTLMRCLCGLEKKFKGKTVIDGMENNRKQMLKQCYMVMQDVNHQLFCENVEDEVCLGMSEDVEMSDVTGTQKSNSDADAVMAAGFGNTLDNAVSTDINGIFINPAVAHVLRELDLENVAKRHPMSLSGGQKQRVAIASALLAEKSILIFDEPTSGLDYKHMKQTAQFFKTLSNQQKTVFIITHDPELIEMCCTHVMRIEGGKLERFYAL